MTPAQHIDYIADNGLTDWGVRGLVRLWDCVLSGALVAVLIALACACLVDEWICKWKGRRKCAAK